MCKDFIFISIIQWILLFNSQISGQNVTTGQMVANQRPNSLRRQWPAIKFEDFYGSGDGPTNEENTTESYIWTTIVTQIKASVLPTFTRVRVMTPKSRLIQISSTPVISCHKYWTQISYTFADYSDSDSQHLLDSILRRSSVIYSGPSSAILSRIESIASSDISISRAQTPDMRSISLSAQSYMSSKSVVPFDRLSRHYSSEDYTLSSSLKSYSDFHALPSIEPSFVISETQSVGPIKTPIGWSRSRHSIDLSSVGIESDKNSIYGTVISFSKSHPLDAMLSTGNPLMSPIETSLPFTSVSAPVLQTISVSKTIDRLLSSDGKHMTSTHTPTTIPNPSPVPLCPESLQTQSPREGSAKPIENYLIRTVLNNTSNESIASIRARIERNIRQIYIYAFGQQYKRTDRMAANARHLLSELNYTDIEVKLWDLSVKNGSNLIHAIYYVERAGALMPYEDAFRTLSYISDHKYSQMIGITVIEKVKPYNDIKVAKSEINWLAIILISCSALIVLLCIIVGLLVLCKYKSEKRKWIDTFHSELNRVVPNNQIHWRTVSEPTDPKTTISINASTNLDSVKEKAIDNSSEFEYLRFGSGDKRQRVAKEKERRVSLRNKGTQSSQSCLEMQKQKVIEIPKLMDESTDTIDSVNQYIRTTFVTTKDIETNRSEDNSSPRITSVQMSEQTQDIIRAIRTELNRIGHNSTAIPFIDDTQPEESIISNSSEA